MVGWLTQHERHVDKHACVAPPYRRPWVAEEYGITSQVWGEEEQKMVFAVRGTVAVSRMQSYALALVQQPAPTRPTNEHCALTLCTGRAREAD